MADSPKDILAKYGQIIVDALRKSLEDNRKVSQAGLLKASIQFKVRAFATDIILEISMNDYWKWVDAGRKPGGKQPPMEAMLKHIKDRSRVHQPTVRKIQSEYKNKKGLTVKRKKLMPGDKARKQLAFLIGRGIKKNGIKPSHFIEEANIEDARIELQNEISEALSREILVTFGQVTGVEIK